MNTTLKIEIPAGYEVDNFDPSTGEIKFREKPKDIKERIKTFADVLKYFGIDETYFNEQNEDLESDEVAYRKVKLIVKALNEGWTPDWSDSDQYKYFPWFNMSSSSGAGFSFNDCDGWSTLSHVGSRLCFKNRDLAKYAGQQFESIYKEFMTI
ncbi:hypothetical protein I6H88_13685 [Elizabethkingia bruuniana]|uniref:Uncharacterized protein n=1 Tax=Elizabethkingia bruuniana TaxID=1756149 RepID=A0A7T7UWH9_9FLAO|nr:hypothetical protein [Elizabethkingia bruuniana]QDZ63264.1 hypothetical protein EVD20_12305 [Elizabethkingia bruuniana]QQN57495.1 hypothetical protein I6H88_13685 [Elizabethkingia bruuniana]